MSLKCSMHPRSLTKAEALNYFVMLSHEISDQEYFIVFIWTQQKYLRRAETSPL